MTFSVRVSGGRVSLSTCLAASIVGPSRLAGGVDSVALMGLHILTATVIVVGFAATLPLRRRVPSVAGGRAQAR